MDKKAMGETGFLLGRQLEQLGIHSLLSTHQQYDKMKFLTSFGYVFALDSKELDTIVPLTTEVKCSQFITSPTRTLC